MEQIAPTQRCTSCSARCDGEALVCPACKTPLTVNVAVVEPVASDRAGTLAELIAQNDLMRAERIESRLTRGRGVVRRGISQAEANWLIAEAARLGARLELRRWHVVSQPHRLATLGWSRRPSTAVAILIALALLLFGLAYVYRAITAPPDEAGVGWHSATVKPGRIANIASPLEARPSEPARSQGRALDQALIEKVGQAVVRIVVPDGVASGFFVSQDGLIVTNYHVVRDGGVIEVIAGSRKVEAKVERLAPAWDLALLRAPLKPSVVLPMADGARTFPTMSVFTVGSAEGLDGSVRFGNVAFVGRPVDAMSVLEVDMAATQGNSGGPLMDYQGRVVGIVNATLAHSERTSYAILSNYLFDGADALLRGFLPTHPLSDRFLRLQLRSLADIGPKAVPAKLLSSSQAFVTSSRYLAVLAEASAATRPTHGETVDVQLWVNDEAGNELLRATVAAETSNASAVGLSTATPRTALFFRLALAESDYQAILRAQRVRARVRCEALDLHQVLSLEVITDGGA